MRRLVAVFSKRDKSDSHQQPDRSHPPSKKHLKLPLGVGSTSLPSVRTPSSITSTPQLSSVSDHGQSSGSSSGSASLSLPTPEENPKSPSLTRSLTRRSWKDWLGKRMEPDPPMAPPLPKPAKLDQPVPEGNQRPHTLQDPRTGARISKGVDDTDEETSSESEGEESVSVSDHPPSTPAFIASPAKARQNLTLLTKNGLASPPPASPFVQHSVAFLFPRSCNRPRALPPHVDVRRTMFRRRLLRRIEKLSVDDEKAILPFASKSISSPVHTHPLPDYEESRPPSTTRIFSASPGLRRWISRPCFEDRFSVFLPFQGGDIHQTPVVSAVAVAALEYSELLDVMVDPDFDPSSPPPDVLQEVPWKLSDHTSFLPISSPSPSTNDDTLVRAQIINTKHPHIIPPSPLRNQGNTTVGLPDSIPQSALAATTLPVASLVYSPSQASILRQKEEALPQPASALPLTQPEIVAPVKRVVRFVEEDGEDVPLLLVRQKKKREEKAKFLRAEQRRRLMEQEQERRRLEAEAMERERIRLAKELERREAEQRQYAEMVTATRMRRETQRGGIIPGLKTDSSTNLLLPSPSSMSLRETERNRPRDSRRHSLVPHHTGSSSSVPRREQSDSGLSPPYAYAPEASNYLTGSGGHSPGGSNSGHGHHSRPGSMYSSSSEDGRHGKRHSMASNNFLRPFAHRAASSTWSGSNQSLINIPPVPAIPPFPELMNDFVLLPPSAPFMMHQHPRRSRNSSPGHSNSSGSLRGNSADSSSERINIHRQSSRSKESFSAPPSPGTPPSHTDFRPMYMGQGSGDSRRSSLPLSAPPHGSWSRSQSSSLSRGQPQYLPSQMVPGVQHPQVLSPWTALPTQHGALPTAMPVSSYSHSLNSSSKGLPSGGSTKKRNGTN